MKRCGGVGAVLLAVMLLATTVRAADETADNPIWLGLRVSLFGDRPVDENADEVIELDAPTRAEDAAVVPLAIRTLPGATPDAWVKKLWLVIDRNPSPVGAVFSFTSDSGRADIETRVRIEEYTWVRAVAEMSDGRVVMTKRYVKASGGCSAPAGKDQAAALARLGKMKLRLDREAALGEPNLAQLMISHPNNSGLAMDQLTRFYVPAHFVRRIDVSYAGRPVMSAEVDFTISENPNLRFWFVPRGEGKLEARVVDSNDLQFETSIIVKPGALAGS
jgi:sulfur-oxidizing protein SoxY